MMTKRFLWFILLSLFLIPLNSRFTFAGTEQEDPAAKEKVVVPAPDQKKEIPSSSKESSTTSAAVPAEAPLEAALAPAASLALQPQIAIRMLGSEYNIQILYDKHPMDHENNNYIESIQMESPKGDFLGLATFGPNAKEAYSEFMVNPKLADFNEVVFIAKSSKEGDIRTTVKLELTKESQVERAGKIAASDTRPVRKTGEKPKKEEKEKKEKKGKKLLFF